MGRAGKKNLAVAGLAKVRSERGRESNGILSAYPSFARPERGKELSVSVQDQSKARKGARVFLEAKFKVLKGGDRICDPPGSLR